MKEKGSASMPRNWDSELDKVDRSNKSKRGFLETLTGRRPRADAVNLRQLEKESANFYGGNLRELMRSFSYLFNDFEENSTPDTEIDIETLKKSEEEGLPVVDIEINAKQKLIIRGINSADDSFKNLTIEFDDEGDLMKFDDRERINAEEPESRILIQLSEYSGLHSDVVGNFTALVVTQFDQSRLSSSRIPDSADIRSESRNQDAERGRKTFPTMVVFYGENQDVRTPIKVLITNERNVKGDRLARNLDMMLAHNHQGPIAPTSFTWYEEAPMYLVDQLVTNIANTANIVKKDRGLED